MKHKINPAYLIAALMIAIAISGCASFNVQQTLGSPAAVQVEVTTLGALAKPYVNANDVTLIHNFASALNGLSNLDATQLAALVPNTAGTKAKAFVSAAVVFVNLALAQYGSHNPTTIAYAKAVAAGVLANF